MTSETQKSRDAAVNSFTQSKIHDLNVHYSQFNPTTRANATAQDLVTAFVRDDRALIEDASLRKHQNLLI
ncbi:hypothetical protein BGX29_008633, partial [Mortierella sp. GBA35]